MMRLSLVTLAAAIWAVLSFSAPAAPVETGKAVGVDPSALALSRGVTRTLVVGADVALGEKVQTGATGQVQLVFTDDTHLVVGPNSSVVIESYLLQRDRSVGKFTINALAGTFRFITGKSAKQAYQIVTPTGTIGVRGTAFDFITGKATTVVLFHGAVLLCNLEGKCVELTKRCDVGTYDSTDSAILGLNTQQSEGLRAKFKYVQSQMPLLPDFRINRAFACLPNPQSTGGLAGGGGPAYEPPNNR